MVMKPLCTIYLNGVNPLDKRVRIVHSFVVIRIITLNTLP